MANHAIFHSLHFFRIVIVLGTTLGVALLKNLIFKNFSLNSHIESIARKQTI